MRHLSAARLTFVLIALAGLLAPAAHAQYEIPPDNPFVSTPGARGEVYALGMRNPYRWSFDRESGDIWIGDVGGLQEEVTRLPRGAAAGANLGWNCLSGTAVLAGCSPPGYVGPAHTYPSSADVVIGGYVVRDPALPGFAGRYLFGRFSSGIYRLEANGGATLLNDDIALVSGFGEDGAGHLYVTSLNGPVYRLGQSGGTLTLEGVGSFSTPVAVAAPPGDTERLFVVEQTGKVKVRTSGQVTDFLDLTSLVEYGGEEGLLAFAVAPDYATSGRVFAYYVDKAGNLQLDEYARLADGPDRSDLSTRKPILTIPHQPWTNHNGGQLLFGPDGYLYLSTGDGGGGPGDDPEGDAQSTASLLGKLLRLDVGVGPGADTVAPRLRARVKRRQRVLRLRGAVARVRCNESCSVIAGGRLRIAQRRYRMLRAGKAVSAGRRARVKVLLTKRGRRALRRALRRGRHPTVRVNLRARDGSGNRSPFVRRTVRVVRR